MSSSTLSRIETGRTKNVSFATTAAISAAISILIQARTAA